MIDSNRIRPGSINVRSLGWLTLIVFGVGGAGLMWFVQGRDPLQAVLGPSPGWLQAMVGAATGAGIGFLAWWFVSRPFMHPVAMRYADMIGPLMQRRSDRIFVSCCAGVGEELLFRGALQHWMGIPLTAVFFVAIHGYLDPRNMRISLYGVMMTVFMIGLGIMARDLGLLAPMVAHAMIDVVLLEKLHSRWRNGLQEMKSGTTQEVPRRADA
jgi:uncharacterized protein